MLDTCPDANIAEWSQIACCKDHTVGLTKEGKVCTCGSNEKGQVGHGDKAPRDVPTRVLGLDGLVVINNSCGENHTTALTTKGDIFTWYVATIMSQLFIHPFQ